MRAYLIIAPYANPPIHFLTLWGITIGDSAYKSQKITVSNKKDHRYICTYMILFGCRMCYIIQERQSIKL